MESNPKQLTSFFKVLIGDFAKKLQIPPAFEDKIDGNMPKNVMIKTKRGASKWAVKIKQIGESLCFSGDGWEMLVVDNDLKYGDFVIFRLISSTVFDIVTYGPNGCEKVVLDPKLKNSETRLIVAPHTRMGSPACASKSARRVGETRMVAREGSAGSKKNLSFVVVLKKHHKSLVTLPKPFAYESGIERKTYVVLKNRQGNLWEVDLRKRTYPGSYGRIDTGDGWHDFWDDNKLKLKDTCLFTFVPGSGNIIQVNITQAK